MAENPIITMLRKKVEDAKNSAFHRQREAERCEAEARTARKERAHYESVAAAAEQAILDIEAADRRRSLYGKEVVR